MHAEDHMPPDTARSAPAAATPHAKTAEPVPPPTTAPHPRPPHEFAHDDRADQRRAPLWPWVLLVLAIIAGTGIWWYSHHHKEATTAPGAGGGGRGGGAGRVMPVVAVPATRGDLP